jgi:DNA-binding NtrC family response regulator
MQLNNTVLIVDDDSSLRRVMRWALRNAGFQVLEYPNALQALTALNELSDEVSVVVSDIDMPGMDGLALARVIAKRMPGLPVLMISGHRPAALDAALPFLCKPFGPDALVDAVRHLVIERKAA